MKTVLIFFTLMTNFSCTHITSYVGGGIADLLAKTGVLDTAYNQDYDEILEGGGKLIYGKLNIYYNGNSITEHCGIGLNGVFDRTGVGLLNDSSGFFLVKINKDVNEWKVIECRYRMDARRFDYTFKGVEFK